MKVYEHTLEAWLSEDREVEDRLAQLRDFLCDVVWAGDDLHRETEALARRVPGATGEHLPQYREAWESVGGQPAIDRFDSLAREISDLLEER